MLPRVGRDPDEIGAVFSDAEAYRDASSPCS
jgi:hypothetical protein